MFWIFILSGVLALVFFKLGAMSVLISALSIGLLVALLVIAGLVIVALWRRMFRNRVGLLPPHR
jgi:hypothetical protein